MPVSKPPRRRRRTQPASPKRTATARSRPAPPDRDEWLREGGSEIYDRVQLEEVYPTYLEALEMLQQMVDRDEAESHLRAEMRADLVTFAKYWLLSNAEVAEMLQVPEAEFASGEWVQKVTPELMMRATVMLKTLEFVERYLGRPATDHWLREPDPNPALAGVVAMEQLKSADTFRVMNYRILVEEAYSLLPDDFLEGAQDPPPRRPH